MHSYDRALTVFSPDGHLFQVEYAMEAVRKGYSVVAVVCDKCIVLGIEKKTTAQLQDSRTVKKLLKIDENITFLFTGLSADARKLVDIARVEAQSYRMSFDEIPSVKYIANYVGRQQQLYTQRGGRRPFGVCTFICGMDGEKGRLFTTDPAGIVVEWKANASGRNEAALRTFLESHYKENMTEEEGVHLVLSCLLETVSMVEQSVDVVVIRPNQEQCVLPKEEVEEKIVVIKEEKKREAEAKEAENRREMELS
ncbi:uncharacterized protein [Blastocystis hominis]|uniref:Proteasome subunit alpha type n=1 Tax=Blastocystis hominis TaxID=12968 RepID=D8LYF7_BLAHO|nr:uncharacterized protein [Blastocystis hominis]CBK20612.2 unnamed protein product [Blastocystis hominis]|eukprot:XP_012894660.1 uncharacterized protein [Blastocystis hominis]